MFDLGCNDNAIRNSVCTKSIMGNVAGNQIGVGDINIVATTPVPSKSFLSSTKQTAIFIATLFKNIICLAKYI